MRVHDSQSYVKLDVTEGRISRILELRKILLSFQTGFNLGNAVVNAALQFQIVGGEMIQRTVDILCSTSNPADHAANENQP